MQTPFSTDAREALAASVTARDGLAKIAVQCFNEASRHAP
jgi:hypothetical protein